MQEVDYKLMIDQEPEFRDFCMAIVFEVFFNGNPDSLSTIRMLHNFYQLGTSTSDVIKFINKMNQGSV